MAYIEFTDIEDLNTFLSQFANIPDEVQADMLNAMAEVSAQGVRETGRAMNIYDPEWNGKHVLDSVTVKKAKKYKDSISGEIMKAYVTFKGKRTRGNKQTRNAEIAFINEFGAGTRGIEAKPFIKDANTKNQDKIYKAGETVFNKWVDSLENK